MIERIIGAVFFIVLVRSVVGDTRVETQLTYEETKEYFRVISEDLESANSAVEMAKFNQGKNITDEGDRLTLEMTSLRDRKRKDFVKSVKDFMKGQNELGPISKDVQYMADVISLLEIGTDDLNTTNRLQEIRASMETTYSVGTIRSFEPTNGSYKELHMNPGINKIFSKSRDYDELEHAWVEWHAATGRKMRTQYLEFLRLAKSNGRDAGIDMRVPYLMDDREYLVMLDDIYHDVLPLYEALFTYVRRNLRRMYPNLGNQSEIFAHLLGNVWAQDWRNLYEDMMPYPDEPAITIDKYLVEQNYTAMRMFKLGENFFKSLGLNSLPEWFWDNSMLVRPEDGTDVNCQGSAWDLYNQKAGILMCTTVDAESLATIHHELGHIYYFLNYREQPAFFRLGANPSFHEAIGETIDLSATTVSYYTKVGLLPKGVEDTYKSMINQLMSKALKNIPRFPWPYILDSYRWRLFNGTTSTENLNSDWWDLRYKYQGLIPPVPRVEGVDFDAGSKYHVAANEPYMIYMLATALSFQLHEALCNSSDLYQCSIYGQPAAGKKLKELLELGNSQPWPDVLERVAGTRHISAKSMMKYFKKLHEWLDAENEKANDCSGWGYEWPGKATSNIPRCQSSKTVDD